MSRVPPPPPGFSLDGAPPPSRSTAPPPPPAGFELDQPTGEAVDGDTLRMLNGGKLRLWGVDAPELQQPGWAADGTQIAIGQQARTALDTIATAGSMPGALQGMSYGRPVAPVTQDGQDIGQTMARSGEALAAPEYLASDPQRRFDYMQAERLARENRLGLHKTFHQSPADFRHNPLPTPDRETVAQFWDTPTPLAGMRPEAEQRYLELVNDPKVPAKTVQDFARSKGFRVADGEVERVRAQSRKSGQPVGVGYQQAPRPLTDLGDGRTGAVLRGIGNGVLPSMLEEVGAAADTLGGSGGRENIFNSERRLADIWANNNQQNEAITGFDRAEHPYAAGTGELAGSLILPLGRVRSAADLATWGGAYGFASGFGQDGTLPERLTAGAIGMGVGVATTVLGTKALEAAAPYAGRAWRRLTGKGPDGAPASPVGDLEGIPSPADGFTADAPARVPDSSETGQMPPPPAGFKLDEPHSMAMTGDAGPAITAEMPRQRDYLFADKPYPISQPMSEAQLRAAAETIAPGDVLPIPSNVVGSVEEAAAKDAGRIVPASAPHERGELTRRTVRAWNGAEVPKAGPIDMVGWLRLNGGIQNQAGDLSHMGLTNASRKGMDFIGQEARFGPLVSDDGMKLDDAAMRAWEAGYFPDYADRPSVNEFLDALRSTHEGRQRNFLPEDYPEIERFGNVQAERYALQQQRFETGQPIYRDTSYPSDDAAPFAPPEAYEEWPAGGPDFAGNIRLEKLESPQDISRALSTVNNRIGFDAATRGRVTQAETERLAAELGMTPDTLLSRRKGQALNAEEALAARQILAKSGNELVNAARRVKSVDIPGDDLLADFNRALQRHVAIQEQVSGATAEAGRALAQFRMIASSRNVRGDVLSAIVSHGGGRRKLVDAADLLLEAAETSPGRFNIIADKATKPGWLDKLVELRINMILSNPPTHIVNMVSNTMTALGQLPEHAAAAGVGAIRQGFAPKAAEGANQVIDRVTGSEVGARAFGLLHGVNEGMAQFARTLRTGEPSDFISKVEGHTEHAIGGKLGSVIRVPTALLAAEDEIFKAMARRMELAGLAARTAAKEGLKGEAAKARRADLLANPTPDMMDRAFDHGRYLTFQRPLGGIASKVSMMTRDYPALKFIVPFVRTPTNLLKFAVERSPGAPMLKEWRADWKAGGARRDLAISRAMVGTGFGMAMASLASRGLITGSPPADRNKERLLRADGWQPYSFKLGDKYYSYQRLDPFATTISVAADLATKQDGMTPRQLDQQAMLLTASIMKTMGDKTWLSGVSDFIEAVSDAPRYGPSYLRRLGASLVVPGGVGGLARAIDPVSRRADTVGEQVMASLPGQSSRLFPRRDVWGAPITNEGGVGPDYLSPMRQSTRKDDPATNEMLRLNATIGQLSKYHTVGGKRVDYAPAEFDRYSEAAGKGSHEAVSALVGSPGWDKLEPEAQRKAIKAAIDKARDEARGMGGMGRPASPRAGLPASVPPPPPGFAIDGQSGGRNVYADLQRLIPGIGLTSGFRTPEYQAEMKRRGYKPADNSRHLDGSSFDLLPPPGKSMGWLKDQVSRYDLKAHLLPEGDHLHVTFPGYYGAPALGGAKAARLKNPLAGMPPPPAGFTLDAR